MIKYYKQILFTNLKQNFIKLLFYNLKIKIKYSENKFYLV
jgi:hypothetical protein